MSIVPAFICVATLENGLGLSDRVDTRALTHYGGLDLCAAVLSINCGRFADHVETMRPLV